MSIESLPLDDGHGAAGAVPVRHDDPRERPLRPPRRRRRRRAPGLRGAGPRRLGRHAAPTGCDTGWASGASTCRPASASSSRWPAAYVANPTCLVLDEATARSTRRPRPASARALESLSRGGRRSRSPTACRPRRAPTASSCFEQGPAGRAGHPRRAGRPAAACTPASMPAGSTPPGRHRSLASFVVCRPRAGRGPGLRRMLRRRCRPVCCSAPRRRVQQRRRGRQSLLRFVKQLQAARGPLADQTIYRGTRAARSGAWGSGSGRSATSPRRAPAEIRTDADTLRDGFIKINNASEPGPLRLGGGQFRPGGPVGPRRHGVPGRPGAGSRPTTPTTAPLRRAARPGVTAASSRSATASGESAPAVFSTRRSTPAAVKPSSVAASRR